MTLTEPATADPLADPDAGAAAASPAPSADSATSTPDSAAQVLAQRIVTSDGAAVGRLFVAVSLLWGLFAAVLAALVAFGRSDAVEPAELFSGLNAYFRMWTLYRMSLLLLVLLPLLLGVAMVVVPRQVGASNLAFPRAALASFWSWLIGSVIMVVSVLAGGGWGALDGVTRNEGDAMALTLLGTAVVIVALLMGAVSLATTIIALRGPDVRLLDVPPFAWSMLVASAAWLFTLPIAVANIVVIYADLRGRPAVAFGRAEGPDIWLQLDWLLEQPAVYLMAVPLLGVVAEVVRGVLGAGVGRPEVPAVIVGLFGLLAVGGWSQDYFTAPQDLRDGLVYVAFGLAAVVPVAALAGFVGLQVAQSRRSVPQLLDLRIIGAAAALALLAAATLAGALRVVEPFDLLESAATWAVFHGVAAAALLGAFVALVHWSDELFGAPVSQRAAAASVALVGAGGAALLLSDLLSGFIADEPDLMALALDGKVFLNVVNFVGAGLLLAGVAVATAGVAQATRAGTGTAEASAVAQPAAEQIAAP
ncbi:MAG: cbb3-type cytochrome c oxidase subunit I [Acidimicrobiaceae bacterium]|nr:cbb3-type cytochrome c oxidase subunit I [Acidimicrobiaceae bacterium]MCY4280209.1 cbb3-type cytochrome c oxidase subunit I [Acidimicrobiaceae bacterium]MCY4293609.1 cbb3-type cytochrome c oxidase subunit I [Acidimicrobiaceae bacterium]